jgi:PleD family two-component response regulator
MPLALHRPTALIVAIDRWLPDLLTGANYDVSFTSSGLEARELAVRSTPDLIVVAPVVEDMGGTEVCRLLRTDPVIPHHVPILILFDGPPTPELRVAALRVGAWDFLSPSAGREDILLKLASNLEAQRSVNEAVDDGLIDPASGFCSQPGLARRARALAALMTRVRGPFACIVIELVGRGGLHGLGSVVARTARLSDVVGDLGASRMAILAPGTDEAGSVRLALRVAEAIRVALATRGDVGADETVELVAGYEVVANAKYSPIEPYGLLRRTVAALQHGEPDRVHPWIRRSTDLPHQAAFDPFTHASPYAV